MELEEYFEKTNQDQVSRYFITRKYLFVEKFLPNILPKMKQKSLDIGSNQGLFTELLKKKGYDSHGIDVNKKFVAFAKKNGKANYKIGSAEKIPFAKNSFEVVLLLDTLEHITDRAKALREINRVLKPGGKAIITVPNTLSYFYIRSFLTYALRRKKPWKNVHYQQNYFHWEHQINNFLKIEETLPILSMPFFEPKLIKEKRLSNFESGKKRFAKFSAGPIFVCTKRTKPSKENSDDTILETEK